MGLFPTPINSFTYSHFKCTNSYLNSDVFALKDNGSSIPGARSCLEVLELREDALCKDLLKDSIVRMC